MSIITPTVGRVVLFRPGSNFAGVAPSDGSPLPALISRVWNDRLINIGGFDADGKPFSATSVPLIQGDETGAVPGSYYAEWMPYQKGQAAKTEALQQQLSSGAGQSPSERPPHQQRVIDEKADLDDKLAKLTAFFDNPIFAGLDVAEQGRLRDQVSYMAGYSEVLSARIAAF